MRTAQSVHGPGDPSLSSAGAEAHGLALSLPGAYVGAGSIPDPSPRVLQVIDNLTLGGAQRLLLILAEHDALPRPLEILTLETGQGPVVAGLLARKAVITDLHGVRLWRPGDWLRLGRALRASDARTVHIHLTYSTIVAAPLAKLLGRRVVVSLHNTETSRSLAGQSLRQRVLQWAEAVALRRFTDLVIFVGDNVAVANRGRVGRTPAITVRNVVSAPPPTDAAARAALRARLGAAPDAPVILSTGRLTDQKDPLTLLRAFASVRASVPKARLWLAGSGPLESAVAAEVAALGLGDAVTLLGERSDVAALLAAADIYALSSAWEGLPLGLIEAMAQGMAVVATRVGDVSTVLDEASGLLVAPRDAAALGAALTRLAADADQRAGLGRSAQAAAQPFTDVEGWYRQLTAAWRGDRREAR